MHGTQCSRDQLRSHITTTSGKVTRSHDVAEERDRCARACLLSVSMSLAKLGRYLSRGIRSYGGREEKRRVKSMAWHAILLACVCVLRRQDKKRVQID